MIFQVISLVPNHRGLLSWGRRPILVVEQGGTATIQIEAQILEIPWLAVQRAEMINETLQVCTAFLFPAQLLAHAEAIQMQCQGSRVVLDHLVTDP